MRERMVRWLLVAMARRGNGIVAACRRGDLYVLLFSVFPGLLHCDLGVLLSTKVLVFQNALRSGRRVALTSLGHRSHGLFRVG